MLYRKLPLLLSHRIPDRAPPALSFPTKIEAMASVFTSRAAKNELSIIPKPPVYTDEYIKKVHTFLVENVLPEKLYIKISWNTAKKKCYGPGLTVFLIYALIKGLEKFYEEEFSTSDRTEIYSKILFEQGFPLTEAKSLIHYFETEKATLFSITEEKQEFMAEPINIEITRKSVIVPPSTAFPNILLDYLSKLSSVLVVELSSVFSSKNINDTTGYYLRANNSIWNIIYNYYPRDSNTLLLPGHPSEILEAHLLL